MNTVNKENMYQLIKKLEGPRHALDNMDIKKSIKELPKPKSDKEKLFVAAKNILTNYYTIKNLEIKLKKYIPP